METAVPFSADAPDAALPALVLLCKRPALGHAKQRLAATLGQQRALTLANALLDCALEDLCKWPGVSVIAPDSSRHLEWARSLAPNAHCLAQSEGNLGQRLNALDAKLRDQGMSQLMFIGSDCPALMPDDYRNVQSLLQDFDTVLLNARDGGVVLMASNQPWPDLTPLPWSTAVLGSELAQLCRLAGQRVIVAGESFDIDVAADLGLLQESLVDDRRPARRRLMDQLRIQSNA